MFEYHNQHPFQYISIVAVIFGITASIWLLHFPPVKGWKHWTSILIVILLTLLISSPLGGILWKIHDMQAGWFPQGQVFWKDLLWGAKVGLEVGWLVIAFSFPYNLFGLVTSITYLHQLSLRFQLKTQSQ